MKTISLISQKGGMGKTTRAIHLAVAFAADGLIAPLF
jgi:cellulose biosynthesis protein BcsQ